LSKAKRFARSKLNNEGGEFVINMVTEDLAQQMVQTSFEYTHGENELSAVGLTTSPSVKVGPPRIGFIYPQITRIYSDEVL